MRNSDHSPYAPGAGGIADSYTVDPYDRSGPSVSAQAPVALPTETPVVVRPGDDPRELAVLHVRSWFAPESAALILHDHEAMAAFEHNFRRAVRKVERGAGITPRPLPRARVPRSHITDALRWEVFERDNFTCQECGSRRILQADHVIPVCRGGPTELANLQTLCRPCNARKGGR